MGAPTDAEIRAVLAEEGITVGKRGRLSADQHAAYERIMTVRAGPSIDDDAPDYPVSDVDGPPAAAADTAAGDHPPAGAGAGGDVRPEQRPRTSKRESGAAARARRLWDRHRTAEDQPAGRARKTHNSRGGRSNQRKRQDRPWMPTAEVISGVWSRVAQAAGGVPPLQRILAAQAPMAGQVFQDRLRDTVTDRIILQPLARAEDQAETVTAMVGVPVLVALISFRGQAMMAEMPDGSTRPLIDPETGMPVWQENTKLMVGALKVALVSWLKVSRRYAADVIAQAEQDMAASEQADQLIAWLFAPRDPSKSWADVQQEAAQRAAAFTEQDQRAAPPDPRPSSAFRPALTGTVLPRM